MTDEELEQLSIEKALYYLKFLSMYGYATAKETDIIEARIYKIADKKNVRIVGKNFKTLEVGKNEVD